MISIKQRKEMTLGMMRLLDICWTETLTRQGWTLIRCADLSENVKLRYNSHPQKQEIFMQTHTAAMEMGLGSSSFAASVITMYSICWAEELRMYGYAPIDTEAMKVEVLESYERKLRNV